MGNLKEFLVVLSAVLLLAGCGSPQNSAESGSGPASTGTLDTASGSGTGGSPELPSEVLRSVSLPVKTGIQWVFCFWIPGLRPE